MAYARSYCCGTFIECCKAIDASHTHLGFDKNALARATISASPFTMMSLACLGDVMRPTALTGIETVSLTAAARCTWYPSPTGMLRPGVIPPLDIHK